MIQHCYIAKQHCMVYCIKRLSPSTSGPPSLELRVQFKIIYGTDSTVHRNLCKAPPYCPLTYWLHEAFCDEQKKKQQLPNIQLDAKVKHNIPEIISKMIAYIHTSKHLHVLSEVILLNAHTHTHTPYLSISL